MLAPKIWIEEFVDLTGISNKKFSEEMTFAGNKVESVRRQGKQTVYEFEITSNRPDTLSVIGLAREAAAIFGRKLKLPKSPQMTSGKGVPIGLKITDSKLCPTYAAVEIDKTKIKPSSKKIQERLKLAGIRAVNNVVDITNYLLWETGQPMHAFDADRICGKLTLRAAKKGEKITPLDHLKRTLNGGEIIIEDEEKLVDLAGLMGGLNTEITDKTQRVYLLVPIYDPVAIRRASKFLRLRSDASTRFEKKIDLTQTEPVLRRAVVMIEGETGGARSTKLVTMSSNWQSKKIKLTKAQVEKRIGIEVKQKLIDQYLNSLEIKLGAEGYQVPSWRRDLGNWVDLIEEIARLYGYNKLPRTLPTGDVPVSQDALKPNWQRIVRTQMLELGYVETYASTMIGRDLIEKVRLDPADHLKVLRPMSKDYEYMRQTVMETMVPFLKLNWENGHKIDLFELGTVFFKSGSLKKLPIQPLELVAVSSSKDYREIKGSMEQLLSRLNVGFELSRLKKEVGYLHPTRQALVKSGREVLGVIGQLHPHILPKMGEIHLFSLNFDRLVGMSSLGQQYPTPARYQSINEDLSINVGEKVMIGEITKLVLKTSKLVRRAELKGDVWRGVATLAIEFNHPTRQLTQTRVNREKRRILSRLKKELGITIKE